MKTKSYLSLSILLFSLFPSLLWLSNQGLALLPELEQAYVQLKTPPEAAPAVLELLWNAELYKGERQKARVAIPGIATERISLRAVQNVSIEAGAEPGSYHLSGQDAGVAFVDILLDDKVLVHRRFAVRLWEPVDYRFGNLMPGLYAAATLKRQKQLHVFQPYAAHLRGCSIFYFRFRHHRGDAVLADLENKGAEFGPSILQSLQTLRSGDRLEFYAIRAKGLGSDLRKGNFEMQVF